MCLALTPDPSPRGRGGDGETVGEARRMAGEARERDGSGRFKGPGARGRGPRKRPGRPTKYDPRRHPQRAQEEAAKGLTRAEVAKRLGIHRDTLVEWEKAHAEFSDALSRGNEAADDRVVRALYDRAIGFTQRESLVMERYGAPATDAGAVLEELGAEIFSEAAGAEATAAVPAEGKPGKPALVARTVKKVKREVAGDVGAQKLWLTNRRPGEWREKQQLEHSGTVVAKADLSGLSTEDLQAIVEGRLRGEGGP